MTARPGIRSLRYLVLLAALACAACSGNFPYSIPIQQGNVITVEMLQELKLGMDKRKVKFVLGTPLVTDAFHIDRWDYYYSYNPGGGDTVQQRASLYFDEDRLVRIDADIQSDIDFHTVTQATDKVLIVPQKKKGGILAAITPGFIARDEQEQAEEAIQRQLDTGFNAIQPGSGEAPAPAGAPIDAAIEPALGAAPALPSEIYAPNTPLGIESAEPSSTRPARETVSAETRAQSRYLESLFDGFGTSSAPPAQPAAVPSAASEPAESPVFRVRDPTVPTRD